MIVQGIRQLLFSSDSEVEDIRVTGNKNLGSQISIAFTDGRIKVSAPSQVDVKRLTLFGFKDVLSGKEFLVQSRFEMLLPGSGTYKLSLNGAECCIVPLFARRALHDTKVRISWWILGSIFVHACFLVGIFLLPERRETKDSTELKAIAEKRRTQATESNDMPLIPFEDDGLLSASMGGVPGMLISQNPGAFRGRSVFQSAEDFLASKNANESRQLKQLSSRLARLRGTPLSQESIPGTDSLNQAALDSALRAAATGIGQGGIGQGGSRGSAKPGAQILKFGSGPKGGAELSPEAEARVRKMFSELNAKFVVAFEQARAVDSSLNLSLSYQGIVQTNGTLGQINFRARGTYSHSGLVRLQNELRKVLLSIPLGRDLSGVVVRGERLFVQ
jgi:hypothetical protein